ncbi:MAG: hypothetical protein AAF500_19030 [Myxococcota bacterium]
MLTALIVALMNATGAAPTPQQLQDYELAYQERMHHVHLDFAGTRTEARNKNITIGLGYEYHIDRKFNGVSIEVLGQKLGRLFFKGSQDWFVGGGLGWWPIRQVKVFMQAGAFFDDAGSTTQGRVGVGYNLRLFMIAIMPYAYVQTTTDPRTDESPLRGFTWAIGARIQY